MTQWDAIARRVAVCVRVFGGVFGGVLAIGLAGGAAAQDSALLSANLYGQSVAGGEGDEDASADWNAEVFTGSGTGAEAGGARLCYYLDLNDLDDASGVALYRGGEGDAGVEVLPLQLPGPDGDEVCVTADAAVLGEVVADPPEFYIQIASRRFPAGAVRGQLSD